MVAWFREHLDGRFLAWCVGWFLVAPQGCFLQHIILDSVYNTYIFDKLCITLSCINVLNYDYNLFSSYYCFLKFYNLDVILCLFYP